MTSQSWIVLTEPLGPPFDPSREAELALLAAVGAELRIAATPEEWMRLAPEADAVLHWRVPLGASEVAQLQKCRVIAHYGVGVDRIDVEAAAAAGVYVTNVPRYGVDEVADHAVTLLLACARKLRTLEASVREGNWGVTAVRPIWRLRGRTLGIIGLGNMGTAVAERAHGFGLVVVAYDPYAPDERFARVGARRVELDELLAESAYITLHVPLTTETRGLIDDRAFARMQRGVVLVNTARGPVIDETALLRALADNTVAAAGLDVFATEPLPLDSPFRDHDRVVLTPHAAFFSEESIIDMQAGASQQVIEALSDQRPSAAATVENVDWAAADRRWRHGGN